MEHIVSNATLEQLRNEYAAALHNAGMTVGERYSNEGQAKLDREAELLQQLADSYNMSPADFVMRFEKGWI